MRSYLYGLDALSVSEGQSVERGQAVGALGEDLTMDFKLGSKSVNPWLLFQTSGGLFWEREWVRSAKSEFERRKLMYPLISVFIIVVGALLLVFANKIIKNNKVNRIGIKVVGGILIIVGLLLLYFLLSGKLTLPLSK